MNDILIVDDEKDIRDLIAEILKVNIEHYYLNNKIKYKNKNKIRKTFYFKSNKGHFQKNK